ncbi:hypothetical protein ACFE04_019452 [Oxalis oulophora]
MEPIQPNCPPSDCWKITAYSYSESKFNLENWHWMLEMEAMKILQYCPKEGAAVIETRNVGGLDYQMSCEELVLTIPKNFETQADFVNYFPQIFRGKQKEKGKYYKLPGVSHFGCAVIFPKKSARLVCLFCAKSDLLSSDLACPHQYDKDESSAFPNLCTHDFQKSVFGCEPTNLRAYCPGKEPDYRKESLDGSVRVMYAVTDGENFLIYVNGSAAKDVSVHHMVLGCEQQGGQCAPPLPTWNYVYEPFKMLELNKTVFFNDNKTFIRYGTYNVFMRMALDHEEYPEKAACCTYILIFVLLTVIPVAVPKQYLDLYYRDCMVVPENNYSTMVMEPIQPNCPPSDCWKSQLTVIAKANLTWKYNMFRHELAKIESVDGMIKVNWHWMLEMEAMKILQYCPKEGAAVIETRNVGGLDYHMSCEELVLTIPKNFETQADFVNYFPQIFRGKQKEKGKYHKLPGVSHFGCAVIFPKKSARLVCLFCAKSDLLSSDLACPHQYDKDESSAFPNLCTRKNRSLIETILILDELARCGSAPLDDFQKSVYGCEPTNLKTYCPGKEPDYRKESLDSSVRVMYAVTDGDNFLIYVNGSAAKDVSVHHMVLGCEQQGGRCAPPLPTWNYVYEPFKMLELNKTVFFNDNKTFIRYGTYNVFMQMATVHEECPEKAACCTYIFIFVLLTVIPNLTMIRGINNNVKSDLNTFQMYLKIHLECEDVNT